MGTPSLPNTSLNYFDHTPFCEGIDTPEVSPSTKMSHSMNDDTRTYSFQSGKIKTKGIEILGQIKRKYVKNVTIAFISI